MKASLLIVIFAICATLFTNDTMAEEVEEKFPGFDEAQSQSFNSIFEAHQLLVDYLTVSLCDADKHASIADLKGYFKLGYISVNSFEYGGLIGKLLGLRAAGKTDESSEMKKIVSELGVYGKNVLNRSKKIRADTLEQRLSLKPNNCRTIAIKSGMSVFDMGVNAGLESNYNIVNQQACVLGFRTIESKIEDRQKAGSLACKLMREERLNESSAKKKPSQA